jgi:hypothetical protein
MQAARVLHTPAMDPLLKLWTAGYSSFAPLLAPQLASAKAPPQAGEACPEERAVNQDDASQYEIRVEIAHSPSTSRLALGRTLVSTQTSAAYRLVLQAAMQASNSNL